MKRYTSPFLLTMTLIVAVCCQKAAAQLASEKPVSSFYSKLTREKLAANKQHNKTSMPAAKQALPSEKALPEQTKGVDKKRRMKKS